MPHRLALLAPLLVLGVGAGAASAQTPGFTSTPYLSTAGARGAVAVDLNRDGWLDLATANAGRNTVVVLLNRGDGTGFGPPREIPVGAGPFDIVSGDLNRDGIPDLVVTTPDAHAIEVLLMGADGWLSSRGIAAPGSESRGAALADITRDGVLDLIYSDYARHRVVVLPGNDDGTFSAALADVPVGARPQGVAAGDFNHDGVLDIVAASTGAPALDVIYGGRPGTYIRRTVPAGRPLNVLTVGDLDADGWDDIAAASTATGVVAFFGGSAAGFTLAGTRPVGASPRGIAHGDFNQDGRLDLAVASHGIGTTTLLLGRPDGSVLPDTWGDLPSGAGARAVALGDFNHDGRLDVAVGTQSVSRITVHENSTAFVRPALSFRRESTGFFYAPTAAADFNENGLPDLLADRNVLLDGTIRVRLDMDPRAVVLAVDAADYNRDGHQDALLAKTIYDPQGRVLMSSLDLYYGDGRGQFTFARLVEGGANGIDGFRTGDLDRDGHLDVVAFNYRELWIVRGIGSGPFTQAVIPATSVSAVELGDVNRDGVLDAVVARSSPSAFVVYEGDGSGSFEAPVVAAGTAASSFALGDMNHDGRLDVVADGGSSVLVVLARDGAWAPVVEYPSTIPWDTANGTILGDFDNDGHLDVLSWGGSMLFGDGTGALGPPAGFAFEPRQGISIDWNRDGLLDIVTGGTVLLNERRAVNRPPVANAGPDLTLRYAQQWEQDDGVLFGGQSADPDLHRLSYEWRDAAGTMLSSSEVARFPPRAPGSYTFTLTVRDGRAGQASDAVRVTINREPEIVLHAAFPWYTGGNWSSVNDGTAASGYRQFHPDAGAAKVGAPSADPSNFVDLYFAADPTQTYKLWMRLKAENDYWGNDSVWVQFSGAVDAGGQPVYAIGTASGLPVNLEECSGCGISGWGWEDDGWGARNRNGVTLRFPAGGLQRIRMQVREDGVSVDQVVLSAAAYLTARPGSARNDTVILRATQGGGQ